MLRISIQKARKMLLTKDSKFDMIIAQKAGGAARKER